MARKEGKKGKFKMVSLGGGNFFEFVKKGDTVTGTYKGSRKVSTKYGEQWLHALANPKGEEVNLWGSTVLDSIISVPKGTYVEVEFQGTKPNKDKRKAPYKIFDVRVPEGTKLAKSPF